MKTLQLRASLLSLAAVVSLHAQVAENAGTGRILTPHSSVQQTEDVGMRAHTNFKVFSPAGRPVSTGGSMPEIGKTGFTRDVQRQGKSAQPVSGYYAETPASLACLYNQVMVSTGCPLSVTTVVSGGSKAIAIVDAYDYPTALADLTAYSSQFGLPAPTSSTFTVAYGSGARPSVDPDCATYDGWECWAAEAALDIEMAHAMAPSAHIYLVEAASASYSDLFTAVAKAAALVKAAGGGEVSCSWGGSEFSAETQYDSVLLSANTAFFFSAGDSEGTEYPSTSPNAVAVGGTTISRDPYTLLAKAEISWEDGGGGLSPYEARPAYQKAIASSIGSYRAVPDVAAIANPRTGVWVYDSYENYGSSGEVAPWNIFGGTSVAAPLWAGIVNHAGHFYTSSSAELTEIYSMMKTSSDFRDITYGTCGYYGGWFAASGWDPCTGVGSPVGSAGK